MLGSPLMSVETGSPAGVRSHDDSRVASMKTLVVPSGMRGNESCDWILVLGSLIFSATPSRLPRDSFRSTRTG